MSLPIKINQGRRKESNYRGRKTSQVQIRLKRVVRRPKSRMGKLKKVARMRWKKALRESKLRNQNPISLHLKEKAIIIIKNKLIRESDKQSHTQSTWHQTSKSKVRLIQVITG